MFEFFDKVLGFFDMVVDVIVNFVSSLLTFVQALVTISSLPTTFAAVLPAVLYVSFSAVMAFAVIKTVVGR